MVWNQVTRFSQLAAVVLFVGVFALGFYLGMQTKSATQATITEPAGE
jgi:hypothetical protein